MGFRLPLLFSYGNVPLRVGLAEETNSSLPLSAKKIGSYSYSLETDEAVTLNLAADLQVGVAVETDSAFALSTYRVAWYPPFGFKWGPGLSVTPAVETDTAVPLAISGGIQGFGLPFRFILGSASGQLATGWATENDTAYALTVIIDPNIIEYGIAGEEYDAFTLEIQKNVAVQTALEYDFAFPIALGTGLIVTPSTETDSAFALTPSFIRAISFATETDEALALTRGTGLQTGVAIEVDTAYRLAVNAQIIVIGDVTETDVSFALGVIKYRTVGVSVDVEIALALTAYSTPQTTVYAWRRVT